MAESSRENIRLRPAWDTEFERLREIEVDAFATLAEAGGADDRDPHPADIEQFGRWLRDGLLLVAADADDRAIAFISASIAGDVLHVDELDVARAWQRRGIGRLLMSQILTEAERRGLNGATLTTDRLAPFNAPFYMSIGFRILDAAELDARLAAILRTEIAHGLDPARRIAMVMEFPKV